MDEWIDIFRFIGRQVFEQIKGVVGTSKARKKLGIGEFGDNTVFIDKLAEDIVIDALCNTKRSCSILTEEKGWVKLGEKFPLIIVDPIDGSLNAKRGIPYYALSIGLADGPSVGNLACGYVMNLSNGDEFWALKGKGAFFNGNRIKNYTKEANVVAVEGIKRQSDGDEVLGIARSFYRVRQNGSTALDMCYTATGGFDAFLHLDDARVIDYAAGKVILEEAGGGLFEWLEDKPFECEISTDKTRRFIGVGNVKVLGIINERLK
ncbi:inositol monophosphatase family protein [Hippea maritima]|uniref:Inositol-phosphate phosphatase n=1 Tax=Hippea maritima (strain ATCC 700847 / DSM 10411 / MH2) TaxID=760142 RepID=F2LW73_HIPMA|nr:inositol monophosphatase family protein [Hippea maritima]AEA34007.1 Inositol-phosphate phosphatase [Hippea maritima DSM 10411]